MAKYIKGNAMDWITAPTIKEAPYPPISATFPKRGWATTPPEEPIKESNDKTVALCLEGIKPLSLVQKNKKLSLTKGNSYKLV